MKQEIHTYMKKVIYCTDQIILFYLMLGTLCVFLCNSAFKMNAIVY